MKRDLISIEDLSAREIEALLDAAAAFERRSGSNRLEGSILATLFLEPSTRTRLSFEAAMLRLGGSVITSADAEKSSSVKGETLADTVRMVDAYADVIVLRHSAAGAARAAARVAAAPVLNAGDGGHEHPSQTLVDLYTLRREVGRLNDLRVVLWGDLRHGRTAHSLVRALCRFGASVLAIAQPGLELPEYVLAGLGRRCVPVRPAGKDEVAAVAPGLDLEGLAIGPGPGGPSARRGAVDAVYVTRLQRERIPGGHAGPTLPPVDPAFLSAPALERAIVMHPLPRTAEIDPAIDADPRAAYFRQAAAGVPVRMALLSWVLGRLPGPDDSGQEGRGEARPRAPRGRGASCSERTCISVREPSTTPAECIEAPDGSIRCAYCETPWPAGG